MSRAAQASLLFAAFAWCEAAAAQTVTRRAAGLRVAADLSLSFPGGLIVVQVEPRVSGATYAVLDGRRCPSFPVPGGLRALVPVPPTFSPGAATLGIEIRGRRRTRIPVPIQVAPRDYPPRTVVVPEARRQLATDASATIDGRHVLQQLRQATPVQLWRGPFRAPVTGEPVYSYGAPTRYAGLASVEALTDSVFGEYHRGMDYPVPAGTVVQAPAAGKVVKAAYLPVTGYTLMLDHGHGVVSAFFHLARIDVREGDAVEARAPLAASGDTGLVAEPHLHWGVYVHGVAVDPRVMERLKAPQ